MERIKEKYMNEFVDMFKHFTTLESPNSSEFMELFYTFENARCLGLPPNTLKSKMDEVINND